jgi:hypothetical protein
VLRKNNIPKRQFKVQGSKFKVGGTAAAKEVQGSKPARQA